MIEQLYNYFDFGLTFALYHFILNMLMVTILPEVYYKYYYKNNAYKYNVDVRFEQDLVNIVFIFITDILIYPITIIIYVGLLMDLIC